MPIRIRGLKLPAKLTGIRSTKKSEPEPEVVVSVEIPEYEPVQEYVPAQEESDDEIIVSKKPKTNVKNRRVGINPLGEK